MSETEVRTRLAPSPTGDPHVGTAYQALFGYVWARKNGGSFILRIEDTDRERSSESSERAIIDSLHWLGLDWDEGPGREGPFGPYRQSERLEIYRAHIKRLVDEGNAYPCFCSRQRLAELRSGGRKGANTGYDGLCRSIAPEEARRRVQSGEEHVVRMKVPDQGQCVFEDLLRGEIRKDWSSVDDQVIQKADGYPTYHMAVVVDDHLMRISHIIRGEEWINSVPKHVLLYRYLGWKPPVFCHLPLLRNPDKSKLSKRKNPTSIGFYRDSGFLPQALLNYLGMMGWSMPGGREKFSIDEMVEDFRLEDINLGGPVFDVDKLRWLNARYIREDHTPEQLVDLLEEWRLNRNTFEAIARMAQGRLRTLADWGPLTGFFFADQLELDPELLTIKGMERDQSRDVLQMVVWELERLKDFSAEHVGACLREAAEVLDIKLRDLTAPLYVAVSGSTSSTPLFGSMEVLGPDVSRMRIRRAVDALGGMSNKKAKKLDKRYRRLFAGR